MFLKSEPKLISIKNKTKTNKQNKKQLELGKWRIILVKVKFYLKIKKVFLNCSESNQKQGTFTCLKGDIQ